MGDNQTAISFRLPVELREQIGEVISKRGTTLTSLVLEYFSRCVQAEQEAESRKHAPGEKGVEVIVLLPDGLYAALCTQARSQDVSVGELVYRLCLESAAGKQGHSQGEGETQEYPDFPKLVDCVRQAYREDRSPIDAMVRLFPSLTPSPIPMEKLFTAALAAVPPGQILAERVELGLRLWREKGRGRS